MGLPIRAATLEYATQGLTTVQQFATRSMVQIQPEPAASGSTYQLQPFFGRRKMGRWNPSVSAVIANDGLGLVTVGTISTPAPASTSLLASMHRWTNTSAAGANSQANNRSGTVLIAWRGNAAGLGGFHFLVRGFVPSVLSANIRGFIGLYGTVGPVAATQSPVALTDCVGLGFESTETNWWFQSNDAAGAATRVDLGAGFPTNNVTAPVTLELFAAPNGALIAYRVERLDTGAVATGTVSVAGDMPASTTFLNPQIFVNNGGDASAVAFDCAGVYLESSN